MVIALMKLGDLSQRIRGSYMEVMTSVRDLESKGWALVSISGVL
jgi:hypothetical protein